MPSEQELKNLVNTSLDEAERIWNRVGHEIVEAKAAQFSNREVRASEVPSHIPGHATVDSDQPIVDDFIALVLDMRDSSNHLNAANSFGLKTLERVLYETSAILPVCSRIIAGNSGRVTEYLGDGLLAFFHAPDSKEKKDDACYKCHDAAVECMEVVKDVVNPTLADRYQLPPLEIGIGMAYSQSIVTIIGDGSHLKPIAFGKCVFDATKLSKGRNQVIVAESLKLIWPTGENGRIKFFPTRIKDHSGYVMHES